MKLPKLEGFMGKLILLILIISISLLFPSCSKKEPDKNHKYDKSFQFNLNEYYIIKINKSQIDELNRTRFITLNNQQASYLKNKVKRFKVSEHAPEGWFNAYWYKPNQVIISKYSIDRYENLMDHKIKQSSNQVEKQTRMEILTGLDGNFYYRGKVTEIPFLLKEIKRLNNINNKELIYVFIINAPIEDVRLKEKVAKNKIIIEDYFKKIREEYFRNKN
jgi:hypothetical protein